MSSLEREELDALVRETLAVQERKSPFVSFRKLHWLVEKRTGKEISSQALSHSVKRIREQGHLEPWNGQIRSANTTYEIVSEACHYCGELHESIAGAIACCDEEFDDPTLPATRSHRGPAPGLVEAHERGESR